ncbi:MAG: energy-coupling factor transporter transmembrane component T [Bacilli bacterium]|jgi:energy-coupling factor transport system permease protein|nr:energy-coupling factor transporter transmembrane component T [Bacilli bacterium]MDY0064374.1 energy-coupling factor transporter transmembrane component T [Bacilli bacterium]
MNDKIIFGQYYHATSWLHRLDPRTKLISLFLMMIATFLLDDLVTLLILFGFVVLIIFSSQIPIIKFLQSMKMMAFLLIFTIFFQIIFTKSTLPPLYTFNFDMTILNLGIIIVVLVLFFLSGKWIKKSRLLLFLALIIGLFALQNFVHITPSLFTYQVDVYESGLVSALTILFRIITLISLSALLTLTTKPTDLNNGLEKVSSPLRYLKINVSILAMMISIALRFIPTLINEAYRILKAQASRGVDFREGKLKEKIMQIISLLIPMFVIAYKRAEDLANAMEARGYIPGAKRTSINELKYHTKDVVTYAVTFAIIIGIIVLKATNAI